MNTTSLPSSVTETEEVATPSAKLPTWEPTGPGKVHLTNWSECSGFVPNWSAVEMVKTTLPASSIADALNLSTLKSVI